MNNQRWTIQRIHSIGCWRTEGLSKLGLPELEIKLPEHKQSAIDYLDAVAKASLNGANISDGVMNQDILRLPVLFFNSPESSSNSIIRIIIADEDKKLPWEPRCEAVYKQQISFNTDKAIYFITQDKKQVNYIRKSQILNTLAPEFKKRDDSYIAPAQYIVNNELFETGGISIRGGLIRCVGEIRLWLELPDIGVICKDTDYSDPINKAFRDYKEKYLT